MLSESIRSGFGERTLLVLEKQTLVLISAMEMTLELFVFDVSFRFIEIYHSCRHVLRHRKLKYSAAIHHLYEIIELENTS